MERVPALVRETASEWDVIEVALCGKATGSEALDS